MIAQSQLYSFVHVSHLPETILLSDLKKAFPWASWIHRHSSDRAYIAYQSQEKVFQICGAPPTIDGMKLICNPTSPFIETMLHKVLATQKRKHALLDPTVDISQFLNGNFVVFCVYASSNSMTVEKWQEFFPHCFYVHRTVNRSKCYVFFTDLQHAKWDAQTMYQRQVMLPTKDGLVYVSIGCRLSTEEEAFKYMADRADNCLMKMAEHDAVVASVCHYVLNDEKDEHTIKYQERFVLRVF